MAYNGIFLVPAYYPAFACKCGDCRTTCCSGWGISLSMEEYFTLLGRECSPELRRKLDTAFHISKDATPERYALAVPDWDGHCRLQGEDGYCMLQRECGESAISAVCRYYPRAPRTSPRLECSTTASCERTLELLFADDEPFRLVECELEFDLPLQPEAKITLERFDELQGLALSTLADRTLPFTARLNRLGEYLYKEEKLENSLPSADADAKAILLEFVRELALTSGTLEELLPELEEFAAANSGTYTLDSAVDRLDIKLEKLFSNHIFYKSFPVAFESPSQHLADEYIALVGAYALTRLVASAHMTTHSGEEAFIDVLALCFRVIEHSNFDRCAVKYFRRVGLDTPAKLKNLLEF